MPSVLMMVFLSTYNVHPGLFGLSGVWYFLPAAKTLAALVTFAFLAVYRRKYGY